MLRRVLVVTFALLVAGPSAFAQQGTSDIRGRVVDQQGAVLPGVTVVVRHQDSGLFRETVTGPDGLFLMSAMTPGVYEVSAELTGFKKYAQRDVRLEVGRTAQVELKLEVGGLTEAVTVSAEAPLVDTSTQEIGGRISAQEFVDTPSFNRNFAGYLGMLPGVVATISATTFGADSISVAGQNVRNVNYTMDGSNNNDTFNGGNGGAQARVPVEAVQEFQLLTSQFDAEYGLASGGIVNSVSKQGTNQYHGSAFVFYQDEKLATNEYFARREGLEEAETKQQQWGGTLGGPIVRDKAHYFASLERVALDGGVTTNIPTRPDLNRTDFETSRVWNTYLRADHQINPSNTYGVRWLRETSPQPLQIQDTNHTPSRHEAETDVDWTAVGNLSSVIGSTKVNTFRVSAVSEDVWFGNPAFNTNGRNQKILPPLLDYLSFEDGQSARASRRLDVAYGADNVFAWFLPGKGGDHDLKFGINYLYSTLRSEDFGTMNGEFDFNTDLPFDPSNPRTYPERLTIRVPGPVNFLMKGHFIGMFGQDRWKLHNNFTLNAGLRYDVEILPTPNQDNPMFADDPDGYPRDLNNVSPRLGFSWALDEQARSAVRGGFGIFYQRTSYTFLTGMFGSNARFSDSFNVLFPTNGPVDELARRFDLASVAHSAGVFDENKLAWVNRHYLKTADPARLVDLSLPFLRQRAMVIGQPSALAHDWLVAIVPALASSVDRLSQVPDRLHTIFSFDADNSLANEEIRREFADDGSRRVVAALAEDLQSAPRLTSRDIFRAAAARVKDRTGVKGRALFHPIRVALTGETEGPELDLLVPAVDRAVDLSPASGLQAVTGCRERAAAFVERL